MRYIYARVSTEDQTVEGQLRALRARYPEAEVVEETASGFYEKPLLNALVWRLRPGDSLVVAALDRLGRRATEALVLIEDLVQRGVTVISEREQLDTASVHGRMMTTVIMAFAQLERDFISQRTKAGLAAAKARGAQLGRRTGSDHWVKKDGTPAKRGRVGRPKGPKQHAPHTEMLVQMGIERGDLSVDDIHYRTGATRAYIKQVLRSMRPPKPRGRPRSNKAALRAPVKL